MVAIAGLRGVAALSRSGRVVFQAADGWADFERAQLCTVDTRFQIASVSKTFAAVAALLLVESGAFATTDPIATWLPDCPPHWGSITLHHLLTHTSGLRHWDDTPGFDPSRSMALAERLALIMAAPLLSEPGTSWRYSSPGYLVVSRLIEQASGQAYHDVLTERILRPLGLATTTVRTTPTRDAAIGYAGDQPAPVWDLISMPGTGDLWSTAGDLIRFSTALHTGDVLRRESLATLQYPHAPIDDYDPGWARPRGYGYGVFVGDLGGRPAIFHPGDNPGFKSFLAWLPDLDASLAVVVNDESVDVEDIARQALAAAFG